MERASVLPSADSQPHSRVRTIAKLADDFIFPIVKGVTKIYRVIPARAVLLSPFASCAGILKTPKLRVLGLLCRRRSRRRRSHGGSGTKKEKQSQEKLEQNDVGRDKCKNVDLCKFCGCARKGERA